MFATWELISPRKPSVIPIRNYTSCRWIYSCLGIMVSQPSNLTHDWSYNVRSTCSFAQLSMVPLLAFYNVVTSIVRHLLRKHSDGELGGARICQLQVQSYVEVRLQHDDCCYNQWSCLSFPLICTHDIPGMKHVDLKLNSWNLLDVLFKSNICWFQMNACLNIKIHQNQW